MKTIELIIMSMCLCFSAICFIDFFVFISKKGAAMSYLTKKQWKLGFICAMVVCYYSLNNFQLIP